MSDHAKEARRLAAEHLELDVLPDVRCWVDSGDEPREGYAIYVRLRSLAALLLAQREACWSLGGGAYSDRAIVSSHTYTYSDRCAIGSDLMPRLRGDVP
jgi:hypothetical protein